MNPRRVFEDRFEEERNFMTPEVVEYREIGGYAVEISRGDGMGWGSLYGVTILESDGRRTNLSKPFGSLEHALSYLGRIV